MSVFMVLYGYILIVNILSFALMGIDKNRAKKRAYRIPEATLFLFALIGGSLGSIVGMHVFHHKTRHWYFLYGMPAIMIIQIGICLALYFSPLQISFL